MRISIKSFLILLFLTIISLSSAALAESVSITATKNSFPANVYKGTTVYGSYLLKGYPGQPIVFKNQLSPWIQQISDTPGDCYSGMALPSTGQCTINLKFSVPAFVGPTHSAIIAGLAGVPTSFTAYRFTIQIVDTPPVPVIISPTTATGTVGTPFSYTITATNSPTSYGATGLPTWLSVDKATGIITGTPTAASIGTFSFTISATNAGGTGSDTLKLTINPGPLDHITVTLNPTSVASGNKTSSTAAGYDINGNLISGLTFNWSSGDPAVDTGTASIDSSSGIATGLTAGSVTIIATSGGVSGKAILTVTAANLISIAVTPKTQSIASGAIQQFSAQGTYDDTTKADITNSVNWSSDNTSAATINNITTKGLATAEKVGGTSQITNITATSTSGTIHDTAVLTVTAANLISIAVTPKTQSIASGAIQQFSAQGTYDDTTKADITNSVNWSSDNTSAATINNITTKGLATAEKVGGTSQITNITATSTSGTIHDTAVLTVTAANLISIAVTPKTQSIASGAIQQFSAQGTYDDSKRPTNDVL